VLVLWILVVISFLSSEYVAHNRQKAAIALHTTELFQQEAAERSLLELFASSQYELLKTKAQEENLDADIKVDKNRSDIDDTMDNIQSAAVPWVRLRPGGVEMWVKVEKESSKIQLSLDQESNIRTTLYSIYGRDREEEADIFIDSLMDWLDPDDLIRLNGAEKAYYNGVYPPCNPGNGPFKSMSQIFMVKGFSRSIFWTNPYEYLSELPIYGGLTDNYQLKKSSPIGTAYKNKKRGLSDREKRSSIMEQFTIYPKECIRVSMLFPGEGDRWHNEVFWVTKDGNSFKLAEQLSSVMVAHIEQNGN